MRTVNSIGGKEAVGINKINRPLVRQGFEIAVEDTRPMIHTLLRIRSSALTLVIGELQIVIVTGQQVRLILAVNVVQLLGTAALAFHAVREVI